MILDATVVSAVGRRVMDVAILDGRIAYIGPRPPQPARREIAGMGRFLLPGAIDLAVALDDASDAEAWERETAAAVAAGVTTLVALPHGSDPVRDRESARRLAQRAARSWCDWGTWVAASCAEAARDAVTSGDALGTFARGDEGLALDCGHASVGAVVIALMDASPCIDTVMRHASSLNGRTNAHLMRVSTATDLGAADRVRSAGCGPTVGVSLPHLFLAVDESPADVVASPPIRQDSDRRMLWYTLKRGRIDTVSSDHHPRASGEGVPGVARLLPLMLAAARQGRITWEQVVAVTADGPARVLGATKKGRIELGADADLLLCRETNSSRLPESDWPWGSREAAPLPEQVLVRGRVTAHAGQLSATEGNGRQVRGAQA